MQSERPGRVPLRDGFLRFTMTKLVFAACMLTLMHIAIASSGTAEAAAWLTGAAACLLLVAYGVARA